MMGDKHRSDRSGGPTERDELAEPARRIVNAALVQRLGEAYYGEEAGRIGFLNLVAGSGATVLEGVVLTHEFHRKFWMWVDSLKLFETLWVLVETSGGGYEHCAVGTDGCR